MTLGCVYEHVAYSSPAASMCMCVASSVSMCHASSAFSGCGFVPCLGPGNLAAGLQFGHARKHCGHERRKAYSQQDTV